MTKLTALFCALLLLGAGCSAPWVKPSPTEPSGPKTREAVYFLVALNGSAAFDQAPTNTIHGCDDRLMLQRDSVPRVDEPAIITNLNRLFTVSKAEAEARGVHTPFAMDIRTELTEERGKPIINIVGSFSLAGTCDAPRVHKTVQETARLTLGSIPEIRLNGSERDWRCLGNESGECQ